MLWQRVMTALILLPIALGIVFYLPLPLFALAVAIVSAVGAYEWAQLAGIKAVYQRVAFGVFILMVEGLICVYSPALVFWPSTTWPMVTAEIPLMVLLAASAFWCLSPLLIGFYPRAAWWKAHLAIRLGVGLLLLVAMWVGLLSLRKIGHLDNPVQGAWLILLTLMLVWSADTGAYIAGKTWGKHKMAPHVSPGKTWEGFVGGLILALLVGYLIGYWLGLVNQHSMALIVGMLITVLLSVCGDLIESLAKREAGLKDSGSLFPGHGGMLDRLDSLVAAAPIFALIALILEWH